ncbi:Nop10 family protein [Pseudoloma neurophilia]|uniref:Nop10 family protein n=1 Tax=Pseudoloma neurophilia TaxID=146866 RepID=A0A0R0M7V1_9MICR|nr:Nop10 family protein [Pseudoloma neurophilia]
MQLHHFFKDNKKIYTLSDDKIVSKPAKYSPLDQFSEERVIFKQRHFISPFY